jgi:hypothetical protein
MPYAGEHPAVEKHYVAMRSRRQPSILAFLAQDAASNVFCYSNADLRKGEENEEVFRCLSFWKKHHGKLPGEIVFDSKLTTHDGLARLDNMAVPFITLRRRNAALLAEAAALPASAWRVVALEHVARKFRTPRVFEQKVTIARHSFRQFFIEDLGHEEPTILLTNQRTRPVKQLITRYAQRMLIENALSDAVRFFPRECSVLFGRDEGGLRPCPAGHRQRTVSTIRLDHARLLRRAGAADLPRSARHARDREGQP